MSVRTLLIVAVSMLPIAAEAQTTGGPLELEAKIPLGPVSGRIDHLTVDLKRQRLFVAELGNDAIGVVNHRLDVRCGRGLTRRVSRT
jgi:hypothetical protein